MGAKAESTNCRIDWIYTEAEWAAYAHWVWRHAFLERAAWLTLTCATAAGCVAHVRGYGRFGVITWGFAGLLLSAAPLALAWTSAASQQAEVMAAPRELHVRPDRLHFCGRRKRLGGRGWRLTAASFHAGRVPLLQLNLHRNIGGDDDQTWTLWAPVPAGHQAEARAFVAALSKRTARGAAAAAGRPNVGRRPAGVGVDSGYTSGWSARNGSDHSPSAGPGAATRTE